MLLHIYNVFLDGMQLKRVVEVFPSVVLVSY